MKRMYVVVYLLAALVATGHAAEATGGFIVQLGCDDPRALAALGGDGCVVQGLDTDHAAIARAREYLLGKGLYGKISVQQFDGKALPYVDGIVNRMIVTGNALQVADAEIQRVVAPRGVTVAGGKRTVKPVPDAIDDWTHYMHDPAGTSVSRDLLAGHPRGMKWTGGPFWARSHEHTAGMNAMVSANGRVFYVMDEGRVDSIQLPAENYLTARDAFSGVVLWKRPLHDWWNSLYPVKSGPGWLPRRLVAVGDRVYFAPGVGQDLLCLDAATGKTLMTYEGTASSFELIVSDDIVYAAVDPDRVLCDYNQQHANCWTERDRASKAYQWTPETGVRVLKAIEADSGKVLWQKETPATPMTLCANEALVCFHDGESLIGLDRESGAELWKTAVTPLKAVKTGYAGPRTLIHGDRVLFAPMRSMCAVSAKTGDVLWTVTGKPVSGHHSLEDFYVIKDKVWVLERPNNGRFSVYSLEAGELVETFNNPIKSFYIHQRCYPGRATPRYQLPPMMGIQVYDMQEDTWQNNHWVRGGCVYGVMPANGMIYATPHACACYYQSKLNGFNALAPAPEPAVAPAAETRLVKGPAYDPSRRGVPAKASEWAAFRHDNERSGFGRTDVSAAVKAAWEKRCAGKVSQPTVAGGKVYFSEVDAHTVHALDAASGETAWSFTADGRIDSPPTLHRGLALFGSADGCVYAVTADKGKLAWKFCAAPTPRKIVSYNQPESVWPVSGSVLVLDDKVYCVAGRSMFLDGGLRMIILDAASGALVAENVMDRNVPDSEQTLDDLVQGKHMPVALPDILSTDGKFVYMKSQVFDLDGRRTRVDPQRPDAQYGDEVHLFSPISFLDDSWHQRTYWIYGRAAGEGWAEFQYPPKRVPCGRIVCIDEKNAYSYGRDPELLCNTSVSEYRLFSAARIPSRREGVTSIEGQWKPVKPTKKGKKGKKQKKPNSGLVRNSVDWHQMAKNPPEKLSALDCNWINEEPDVMAKAMVLANNRLFVAGPRDVADEKALWGKSNEEGFKAAMGHQLEWLENKRGGVLQVFSKEDGKKLNELKLDSLPAFDGLVAAEGKLFMATADGAIVCFE